MLLVTLFAASAYLFTGEGQLTLRLPDPGHRVEIDGHPAASNLVFLPERTEQHFRLPPGHHSVRVSKPGHLPLVAQFWLVRNRHVEFDVLLARDPQSPASSALPSEQPHSGPPIATSDPANAWELSIRPMSGEDNDELYRPVKADWVGAERVGLVKDALFFGPFGAEQPDSIWIFRTQVRAKAARTVEVYFGHDDGGVMYLNGELVNSAPTTAGRLGHLAFVGPLRFRPGLNTVEMAVYVAQGASSINLGAIAPQYKHALSQVPDLNMRAPP